MDRWVWSSMSFHQDFHQTWFAQSDEAKWKKFKEKYNSWDSNYSWSDIEAIEEEAYDLAIEALQKEGMTEEQSRDENTQEMSVTYSTVYGDENQKYSEYSWKKLPSWIKEAVKNESYWKELWKYLLKVV